MWQHPLFAFLDTHRLNSNIHSRLYITSKRLGPHLVISKNYFLTVNRIQVITTSIITKITRYSMTNLHLHSRHT